MLESTQLGTMSEVMPRSSVLAFSGGSILLARLVALLCIVWFGSFDCGIALIVIAQDADARRETRAVQQGMPAVPQHRSYSDCILSCYKA